MKKWITAFACVLPLLAGAQAKDFTLKVALPGLPDSTQLFLIHFEDNKPHRDSVWLHHGTAVFTGQVSVPGQGVVRTETPGGGKITDIVHLYIEPGTHTLEGKDSLHNAVVHSTLNDELRQLTQSTAPYSNQLMAIRAAAQKLPKTGAEAEIKTLNAQYKNAADTFRLLRRQFISTHPDSYLALETLKQQSAGVIDVAEVMPLFEHLSPAIRATPLAVAFAKDIAKAEFTQKGRPAPMFTSYTPAGDSLRLKDLVGSSRLLLVDFWASWCSPCRAENPNVVKAYNEYHSKGFDILSVSLDNTAAPWKAAIAKDGMPWHHVSNLKGWADPIAVAYSVNGIPDNFLLDEHGVILARGLRKEELHAKLKSLLK